MRFYRAQRIPDAGVTILEINNHSIADAHEVEWDLRYSDGRSWIKTWIRTEIKRLEEIRNRTEQEEAQLRHYKSMDISPVSVLKASGFKLANISGVVPSDLCDQATPENKYPVQVKSTWRSEKGQRFSTEIVYGLVCTKVGEVEKYDFIGGEVLSQGV